MRGKEKLNPRAVDLNLFLGTRKLPSREAHEWTTPTEGHFSVSVSPYIACVEAVGGGDEDNKRQHGVATEVQTPRARPGKMKTGIREETDGKGAKGSTLYLKVSSCLACQQALTSDEVKETSVRRRRTLRKPSHGLLTFSALSLATLFSLAVALPTKVLWNELWSVASVFEQHYFVNKFSQFFSEDAFSAPVLFRPSSFFFRCIQQTLDVQVKDAVKGKATVKMTMSHAS